MRKLNLSDVFKFARMVKSLELKEEVKAMLTKFSKRAEQEEADPTAAGVDFVFDLLEIFTTDEAEREFYGFISGPLEVSPKEAQEYAFVEFASAVVEIASIKDWKVFFKQVSALMQ